MKRLYFWGLLVPAVLRRTLGWMLESPLLIAARHPWITLGLVAIGIAVGALAIAASGVIPMKASTGHWPITADFLHWSMRRSVATNSLLIQAPALDDPALVLRGAGHYELACRPCHGAADGGMPMIPRAITPPPRQLKMHAGDWRPRELFYIVKHGMKFTGMPAWPAQQRDDEVWAMVAFLRRLPELTVEEYERLVRGGPIEPFDLLVDAPAPEIVAANCARCHGMDGRGRGGAFPSLAGQRAEYLDRALRAYAEKRRHSGIMEPIAAALSDEARRDAVQHYASLAPPPPVNGGAGNLARGREIATNGIPGQMIPACVECHGPAARPKNPAYPRLAGQHPGYLAQQLRLLRDGRRGGSEYVHLMQTFARNLKDEDIRDVARYFAGSQQPADGGQ